MTEFQSFECEVGGRSLIVDAGKLAGQASGAVTVRYGDTVVLVTVCLSSEPRSGVDFLPLTVDYEERLYAAGKIPGGFIRREGRPSQEATLASRLTDRPLRPLLPCFLSQSLLDYLPYLIIHTFSFCYFYHILSYFPNLQTFP